MLKNTFSNIISEMNRNDNYCQGASQQMANGFYRIFDALVALSGELEGGSANAASVRSIQSTLNSNNIYCQGAPQQCANGSYRIVEILQVIISQLDKSGSYRTQTNAIIREMNSNNIYCQGAPQQCANGSYRIVEMLDIIAKLVAPGKSSSVSSTISAMNRNNVYCQGAPQQSANGTDAAFVILQYIVGELDTKNRYTSSLSSIASLKSRNNAYCQGADQQSANNLYRIMETIQVLGNILQDRDQERIEAYWNEHKEEHDKLLQEKSECRQKIAEVERQANAINEDEKIGELKKEANALTARKNACGAQELQQLQGVIDQRKAERAEIGFFKFALRKEAAARIDEAKADYSAKLQEVNGRKADIQRQIDGVNKRIDDLNADVKKRRAVVLSTCDIHKRRIESIETELTKKR